MNFEVDRSYALVINPHYEITKPMLRTTPFTCSFIYYQIAITSANNDANIFLITYSLITCNC